MNIAAEQAHVRKNLGEYARGAESDCARAMAEAERVLRELSLVAHFTRQSNPGCSSTADETSMAQRLVSRQSAVPSLSPSSIDRLPLDPGLDFVVAYVANALCRTRHVDRGRWTRAVALTGEARK